MNPTAQTVAFQPGERNLFFHILTACNLSCRHCYINPGQHGSTTLPKETMLQWLELFAAPGKKSNVIFLGGEPTMHPELSHGIKRAKELGMAVTVDSNGFLFNDILNKTSPDLLDFLSFSLDGPDAAVNDPIRGQGVFDICTANMRRALDMGYNVSVIYTVSSLNISYLHRMVPLLADMGVKRFFIQVIGLRGNSAQESVGEEGWQVSPEQWLDTVPRVAQAAVEAGIHVTYPKVFLGHDETFECAGRVTENFFIFPNGRVYRCPLCEDHPIHSLEIKEKQLVSAGTLTEENFFQLNIAEGCVMNKLLQPDTISYNEHGKPDHVISCCLLKQELLPG
jgi:MoaA/NifB/PqqE/SkfB family radical SAM enzyme